MRALASNVFDSSNRGVRPYLPAFSIARRSKSCVPGARISSGEPGTPSPSVDGSRRSTSGFPCMVLKKRSADERAICQSLAR